MIKIYLTFLMTVLFVFAGYSQTDDKKESYLEISAGVGNDAFSIHNHALNATANPDQLIFTPTLIYHHKSGFGIGATTYIANDSISSGVYQTGLIGSYDYIGKEVKAGITYTRFLTDEKKYNNRSIYQNDFYAYVKRAKGIIQPVLMLGYSNGNYRAWDYAYFYRPVLRDSILIKDSTTNRTSFFSFTLGVEHEFNLSKIFTEDDELEITPSLLVNSGTDNLVTNHLNKAYNKLPKKSKLKKIVSTTNKFELQSFAASLEMNYNIDKFFVQPNLYCDYYLPPTTSKRLTFIYSVVIGFNF